MSDNLYTHIGKFNNDKRGHDYSIYNLTVLYVKGCSDGSEERVNMDRATHSSEKDVQGMKSQ